MDERAGTAAPPELRELFEMLFERVEVATGQDLTSGRTASVEIQREGGGYWLFTKSKWAGRDLFEPDASTPTPESP
ncbi:MAG TPA: hypothetical protein VFA56_08335 [Gaiellaceae bacterium]|nr:hypothetical protein [Gaiellaceae bacterium]